MNTAADKSKIKQSFDAYEAIQMHHLEILRTETVPDLERMNSERGKVFQSLKADIEDIMKNTYQKNSMDSVAELDTYQNRLNLIMKLDEEISIEIKQYRNRLKTDLRRMKKGKKAMLGYKKTSASTLNPCVVSMNR